GSTPALGDSWGADNQGGGGQGEIGDSGGRALGGGVANALGGVLIASGSTLPGNQVRAGAGGAGGNGGSGRGGGLFNDGPSTHPSNPCAPTILVVSGSTVTGNEAVGGAAGESGEESAGIGGGQYLPPEGEACVDLVTLIFGNRASTSNDDIFGDLEECRERV